MREPSRTATKRGRGREREREREPAKETRLITEGGCGDKTDRRSMGRGVSSYFRAPSRTLECLTNSIKRLRSGFPRSLGRTRDPN